MKRALFIIASVSILSVTSYGQCADSLFQYFFRTYQLNLTEYPQGAGYQAGTNAATLEVGNNYDFGTGYVTGAYFWTNTVKIVGSSDSIRISVYQTDPIDSLPTGPALGSMLVATSDFDTVFTGNVSTNPSYFEFPNPIAVNGRFAVCLEVNKAIMDDTLAVFANAQGDGLEEGRSILRDTSGNWYHYYQVFSFGGGDRYNADLMIFPTVIKEFSVVASSPDLNTCAGNTVSLNGEVYTCNPSTSVEWSGPGITNPFNARTTAAIPASATDSIVYTFTAIDLTTNDTVSTQITIHLQNIYVDAGADVVMSCDTTGNLQAVVSGVSGAGTNLLWSNGITTPQNNNLGIGTYTITVSNSYGCTDIDTVEVRYNSDQVVDFKLATLKYFCYNCPPDTLFISNGTAGCTNHKTIFINESNRINGWNWKWQLGDPDSTLMYTPNGIFNYSVPGNIQVTLTADSSTCMISKTKPYQLIQAGFSGPCIYIDVFPPDSTDTTSINTVIIPAQSITIYPNPNTGSFSIDASGLTGDVATVRLLNILGEEVYTREHALSTNDTFIEVSTPSATPGLYLLYLEADGKRFAQKVQVE